MTDLNDLNYVNDDDDVKAEHVNELLSSALLSRISNAETLAGTRALLATDTPIQNYVCSGSNGTVLCPEPNMISNHLYWIVNSSEGTEMITVRDYADTIDVASIASGSAVLIIPDGAGNYIAVGSGSGSGTGSGETVDTETIVKTMWAYGG